MNKFFITGVLWMAALGATAQQSELLSRYRILALDYNHDLRAARENIAASMEMVGAARADLKPHLSAGASYQIVGNPIELNITSPSLNTPLHFEGKNQRYGATASLMQPVYTGGRLIESLKKAERQSSYASNQHALVRNAVYTQTDALYWNSVARREIASIAQESKQAVEELAKIVSQRVEVGYTDPTDLLMAEVKLNEAEYQLKEALTVFETSRMSLNSFLGTPLTDETALDTAVVPILTATPLLLHEAALRPEQQMASDQVLLSQSDKKLIRSKYLPQIAVGAEGSYQFPGYDFSSRLTPNYGFYATLSVPIFEWGKRGKESRAASHRIRIAHESLRKVDDQVSLEISSARVTLTQAIEQVNLTRNSLAKAEENERRSTQRYTEGKLSIYEVLQAQLYRQSAQINHVQAKLAAQNSWSDLQRALNLFDN